MMFSCRSRFGMFLSTRLEIRVGATLAAARGAGSWRLFDEACMAQPHVRRDSQGKGFKSKSYMY